MAELKTKPTSVSVDEFIAAVEPARQEDCRTLMTMMAHATGVGPKMWGPAIVGFGDIHYKYESGREADWFPIGFSPRKNDLTLYLMGGLDPALLNKLGKHKRGKGCLYINKLSDIDLNALDDLLAASLTQLGKIVEDRKKSIAAKKKKGTARKQSL
jgi:hypothetical protein